MPPEKIKLSFGPSAKPIGAQYVGDPTVDEGKVRMDAYSVLDWIERFPHWALYVKFLPDTPPPPGEAAVRAAAVAEGRDAEEMLKEAREKVRPAAFPGLPAVWAPTPADPRSPPLHPLLGAQGDVAKLENLPPPWGEADHSDPATEEWKKAFAHPGETERPPNYGAESHPSVTAKRVGPGGWTPADLPAAAAAEEAEEAEPAAAEAGDGAPAAAAAEAAPVAPLD